MVSSSSCISSSTLSSMRVGLRRIILYEAALGISAEEDNRLEALNLDVVGVDACNLHHSLELRRREVHEVRGRDIYL